MSTLTDAMRRHHRALLEEIGRSADTVSQQTTDGDLGRLVSLLQTELLPHARGEERFLYPAIDPLVAAHARPTATMSVDHEFIEQGIADVTTLVAGVRAAADTQRAAAIGRLRDRLLELRAILRLHTDKEERVYFPLLEAHLSAAEQERLLQSLHEA